MAVQDYDPILSDLSSPKKVRWYTNAWLERFVKACVKNAPGSKKEGLKATEVPITVEQRTEAKGAELSLDLTKLPYVEGTICVAGQPVQVKRVVIPETTQ